jgi:hypothetical protein
LGCRQGELPGGGIEHAASIGGHETDNKSERLSDMIAGVQTRSVELWNGRPECLSSDDFEPSGAFASGGRAVRPGPPQARIKNRHFDIARIS